MLFSTKTTMKWLSLKTLKCFQCARFVKLRNFHWFSFLSFVRFYSIIWYRFSVKFPLATYRQRRFLAWASLQGNLLCFFFFWDSENGLCFPRHDRDMIGIKLIFSDQFLFDFALMSSFCKQHFRFIRLQYNLVIWFFYRVNKNRR